jgi:hypothetical protein
VDGQISIFDMMREQEAKEPEGKEPPERPVAADWERVYRIPDDVWETRCQLCVHKNADDNIPIPASAIHRGQYERILPCRILSLSRMDKMPGECMSFSPKHGTPGICDSCRYNNIFHDGFCMKDDHAQQRRVYYGTDYGGDERKVDYYSRHRLSVCDDYERWPGYA